jgi:hypothetical protein
METYFDPTTRFKYNDILIAGGTVFKFRGCGVNKVIMFITYGCCYYTSTKFNNDAILIKMYRSIGKMFILKSIRKSLLERNMTPESVDEFIGLISDNFDAFNYKDEILLLFNDKDLEVYRRKADNETYDLLKIFPDSSDLSMALRNCFFDERSVAPMLRDKVKEYLK